jgi:hypothetical protein
MSLGDFILAVFRDPALATSAHSLHFLRAYHLIDVIRQTTQEDVEFVLLNSAEFTKSDKKKGVFTYHEPYVPEEETPLELGFAEAGERAAPEAYTPEEAALEAVAREIFAAEPDTGIEAPRREPAGPAAPPAAPELPPRKDKPKRKKPKTEGEKGPRPKKSERRVLEEKIVEEESVQEALAAVKEKEEEVLEQRGRDKKEEFKPSPKKEEPKFGLFGDLLKTALKKKPEDESGEEPEPGEPPADTPDREPD